MLRVHNAAPIYRKKELKEFLEKFKLPQKAPEVIHRVLLVCQSCYWIKQTRLATISGWLVVK